MESSTNFHIPYILHSHYTIISLRNYQDLYKGIIINLKNHKLFGRDTFSFRNYVRRSKEQFLVLNHIHIKISILGYMSQFIHFLCRFMLLSPVMLCPLVCLGKAFRKTKHAYSMP